MYRKTFIEIDTQALKDNVRTLLATYPTYEYYFGVVKGNAYGHGYDIIPHLEDAGINYFAVSSLEEALEVRQKTQLPILCLQPVHNDEYELCSLKEITVTVTAKDQVTHISQQQFPKNLKVHLKIDSGMNRLGFKDQKEFEEAYAALKTLKKVEVEGIFSHFATSGIFDSYFDIQLQRFKQITKNVPLENFKIRHFGRSLTLPNLGKVDFCNGVRLGLVVYGLQRKPTNNKKGIMNFLRYWKRHFMAQRNGFSVEKLLTSFPELNPVMRLVSEVIEIKDVAAGDKVGYGASFAVNHKAKIAVVAIGYADGFNKRNKNGWVSIGGKRYQMVSEVNMGMLTVLVDDQVKVGDEVELIGKQIHIREVSERVGTTNYETMCALQNTLPRILK